MDRGPLTALILITAMMFTSLFAGIDLNAEPLEKHDEKETGARQFGYELEMMPPIEPLESFVDAFGVSQNVIFVNQTVHFRPVIMNIGGVDHDEFNIRVTVTTGSGIFQQTLLDNLDDVVCAGDVAVTGCSFSTLESGEFLGGGDYRIQAASGGDLTWVPTIAGTYRVHMEIDVDPSMDSDLTNNEWTYAVVVQSYRDFNIDACWTDGPTGDCLEYDHAQGAGPHDFAVKVSINDAFESVREVRIWIEIDGRYESDNTGFWLDGNFITGHSYAPFIGETRNVTVWQNLSESSSTITDAYDVSSNPCVNGANPCTQDRMVPVDGVEYTYRGQIQGRDGSGGDDYVSVSAVVMMYDELYTHTENDNVYLKERYAASFDCEEGVEYTCIDFNQKNNIDMIYAQYTIFHRIKMTNFGAGEQMTNVPYLSTGLNQFTAEVVFDGREPVDFYDWNVTFYIRPENGSSYEMTVDECLADSYTHTTLSITNPGSTPEGWACIHLDLDPGRYEITAFVGLIGENSSPNGATQTGRGGLDFGQWGVFIVRDNAPIVNLDLQSIEREGTFGYVPPPIIEGDTITLFASAFDVESDISDLTYSWERFDPFDGEGWVRLEGCSAFSGQGILGYTTCTVNTDSTWAAGQSVRVTVFDEDGNAGRDSMVLTIASNYTANMDVLGAHLEYSLIYTPQIEFNVTASGVEQIRDQQLANNPGTYDSVVAFDLVVSHVFNPSDIGLETLNITFNGDSDITRGLWYKRTSELPWQLVYNVTSINPTIQGYSSMVYSHDGSVMGNLNGGRYAIFDVATAGNEPPATGVTGLTATLQPGAQVIFDWGYVDDSLLSSTDTVNVYHCSGVGCDPMAGNAIPSMNPTTTSWTLIGTDGESYTVHVQTENGEVDGAGSPLTGGGMAITVTADGSVSPAPSINADIPTIEGDSLTFTWTATDTDDVASWMVCWAPNQWTLEDSFDSVVGDGACAETTDATTSLTVTEQYMCGGSCNSEKFFAIGAKDAIGNVYSPDGAHHMSYVNYGSGVVDPDDIDGGIDSDDDGWNDTVDQCPSLWGNSTLRNGCPDSDNDEIIDPEDDCPSLFGTSTQPVVGCPDDDSDGWANANDTFPSNANEWYDADGDLVGDNADQCPNTALDVEVGRDGCELPEESNIVLYSVAGGGLAGASLLFFLLPRMMRGMNAEEQKERMKWDDQVWQEPQGMPMGPPVQEAKQPGPELTGVNQSDGYEYLEWPTASGDWWYRTGAGLDWSKWEQ